VTPPAIVPWTRPFDICRPFVDVLDYLLTLATPTLIGTQNDSGSTALHWASLNSQLDTAKRLVNHPNGPGIDLIDIKNKAGRSPLGEAELIGWEEGAKWFVEVMRLEDDLQGVESTGDGDAVLDNPDGSTPDIEVEIQDADGGIARMTISGKPAAVSSSKKAGEAS